MTKSQITSAIATLVTLAATVESKASVLSALLPPTWAKWIPLVVIIAGIVTTAFNQSLSGSHISIPVEDAQRIARRMPDAPSKLLSQVRSIDES